MNGYAFRGWIAFVNGENVSTVIFEDEQDAICEAIYICDTLSIEQAEITTEFVDEVLSAEQMKQALDPYLDESDYAD